MKKKLRVIVLVICLFITTMPAKVFAYDYAGWYLSDHFNVAVTTFQTDHWYAIHLTTTEQVSGLSQIVAIGSMNSDQTLSTLMSATELYWYDSDMVLQYHKTSAGVYIWLNSYPSTTYGNGLTSGSTIYFKYKGPDNCDANTVYAQRYNGTTSTAFDSAMNNIYGYVVEVSGPAEPIQEPAPPPPPVWSYNLKMLVKWDRSIIPGLQNPNELKIATDILDADMNSISSSGPAAAGGDLYIFSDSAYTNRFGVTFWGNPWSTHIDPTKGQQTLMAEGNWPMMYFDVFPSEQILYWKFVPTDSSLATRYGKIDVNDIVAMGSTITVTTNTDLNTGNSPDNPDQNQNSDGPMEYQPGGLSGVIKELFMPTQITTDAVSSLSDNLKTHAPFSWVTSSFEAINNIIAGMNSSQVPAFEMVIMGTKKTFEFKSPWIANIRPITTFLIWAGLLVFGYKQYRSITGSGGE